VVVGPGSRIAFSFSFFNGRYDKFFVDHMMTEELGMMPPEPKDEVFRGMLKNSLVMFTAFLVYGLIPLLSYLMPPLPS
jgi:hypothetical protein